MRIYRLLVFFLLLFPSISFSQKVLVLKIEGIINAATADYVQRGIEEAGHSNYEAIVLQINTPGGVLNATRTIVSSLLESPVPTVSYVSPGGAHAGSAGVFITMAANIAAMAPGTNIGAAHPVALGGTMDSIMNAKATNDATAFIRTIAQKRNRNLQWAEEAVTKSISITSSEALEQNVINLVADNMSTLLAEVNGKTVETATGTHTLKTTGAETVVLEMGAIEKILNIISDPNLTYILFLLGLFGLLFELFNPGLIFPGIVGVISLVLSLYAMQTLPINYAGLALIVFGIVLFLLEIKIVSHGLLAIGGIVSLFLGSMILIRSHSTLELVSLSKTVIFTSVAASAFFFLVIIGLGLKAQKRKPAIGINTMIGEFADVIVPLHPTGSVKVNGEIWQAESIAGNIEINQKVKIVEVRDLKLFVEPIT